MNDKCVVSTVGSIANFVRNVRNMIIHSGNIPDLAGIGNMVLTPKGEIKLVDINNIIKIPENDTILLDDPFYGYYLTDERKEKVHQLENIFYKHRKFSHLSSTKDFYYHDKPGNVFLLQRY